MVTAKLPTHTTIYNKILGMGVGIKKGSDTGAIHGPIQHENNANKLYGFKVESTVLVAVSR